jgi:hypothetical protein
VRCNRCGNENPESHRFCGMCGTSLLAGTETQASPGISSSESASHGAASSPQAKEPAPPRPPRVETSANALAPPGSPRPSRVASSAESPIISGPSFLGLNQPSPAERIPRGHSIYALDQAPPKSSRNLDYLLEDDEEEPRRGRGKVVMIFVALLLCAGFGYLRWKTGGFSWLTAEIKAAVQPATRPGPPSQTDSSSPGPPTPGTATTGTDPSAAPASASPAGDPSSPPAGQGAGTTPGSDSSSSPPVGSTNSGPNNSAPSNSAPAGATGASAAPSAAGDASSRSTAAPSTAPAATPPEAESKPPESNETASADSTAARPDSKTDAPAAPPARASAGTPARNSGAVPGSKPTPAIPSDSVVIDAEKYIYGRGGVAQDCDRGLKMLRTSAYQSNEKAMISLGALYSTGLCAPRDLPTAYRWFAVALRKEPDNPALQQNLQKLWSQMTQPERHLAIKLSQ